jgi:hypothetical protein
VIAYELVSGQDRAVLVVMSKAAFPFQLGGRYLETPCSSHRVDIHYLVSGRQVAMLVVPDTVAASKFFARSSVT